MISRPLFKQSCKANGVLWTIITLATCFMLAVVILVIGNGSVSDIKSSLTQVITTNYIDSEIKENSMNYYYLSELSLENFEANCQGVETLANGVIQTYNSMLTGEETDEQKQAIIYGISNSFDDETQKNLSKQILEIYEFNNVENLNSIQIADKVLLNSIAESLYNELVEEYDEDVANQAKVMINQAINQFIVAKQNNQELTTEDFATDFISVMISKQLVNQLQDIEYDYPEEKILDISKTGILDFRANLSIKYNNQTLVEIGKENIYSLIDELSENFMDQIPENIAGSLEEIKDMDMFALIVGSIFFKIAGLLLPFIYVIMTANNLIAGQVDSGSMAYTLSTPTKRRTVTITQMMYLISSLFVMMCCTMITGLVCLAISKSNAITISYADMVLFNLCAFVVLFAVSGICFLASCWFNRSKRSMALGGGLSMYFLVASILGLFGSTSLPSIIRIDAMRVFNYTSLISLFDVNSIIGGTTTFIWKLAILIVVGAVCYFIAIRKFDKKDLPL